MDGRYDSERLRWGGDDDRYLGYRHERLRGFGNRLMDRQTFLILELLLRLKIHARFKYRKYKLIE